MYAVQAAEYWAEHSGQNVPKNADGKYEIAIDTYYDIADGVYRSNAVKGTVEKSDILALVNESTSYGDGALNTAINNAQAVLNANPDCHIFVAYEPEEAMGINNAILDYCEQTGSSPADYFVAPCYGEDTTLPIPLPTPSRAIPPTATLPCPLRRSRPSSPEAMRPCPRSLRRSTPARL